MINSGIIKVGVVKKLAKFCNKIGAELKVFSMKLHIEGKFLKGPQALLGFNSASVKATGINATTQDINNTTINIEFDLDGLYTTPVGLQLIKHANFFI